MLEVSIRAQTTETMTVTVKDGGGTVVQGATVAGVFRDPDLRIVAAAVGFTDTGANGKYAATMAPAWTDINGMPRIGTFYMDITVTQGLSELNARVVVHVTA